MTDLTAQGFCTLCQSQVLSVKKQTNHILHLLMSLVTLGLWLPIWLLVGVCAATTPYLCSRCGSRVR